MPRTNTCTTASRDASATRRGRTLRPRSPARLPMVRCRPAQPMATGDRRPPARPPHRARRTRPGRACRGGRAAASATVARARTTSTSSVPAGRITVLLGPNGAGKTTAIRMITGALDARPGHVRDLRPRPRPSTARRCAAAAAWCRPSRRSTTACRAATTSRTRPSSTASAATPIDDRSARRPARFGIDDALDQQVGGYSTGMKTRLALARSVLHDPELLLFDEPTSGLDPESRHAVLELIREMTDDGRTVVMCTHLLLEAEGLADQIVVLEDGTDLVSGTPGRAHPALLARRRGAPRRRGPEPARPRRRPGRASSALRPRADGGRRRSTLDDLGRVPDLVAALVADGRAPHPGRAPPPHARGPLLRRPRAADERDRRPSAGVEPARRRRRSPMAPATTPVDAARPTPRRAAIAQAAMRTVARTDLKQLIERKDFWVPMVAPRRHLLPRRPDDPAARHHRIGNVGVVQQVSPGPEGAARRRPRHADPGHADAGAKVVLRPGRVPVRPIAVVVPLTISTAVGAATIVGERERGTGEFLAHSPADVREIYLGKLIASLVPGYLTTIVGFGALLADRQPDRRPRGRRLVLPHRRSGGC